MQSACCETAGIGAGSRLSVPISSASEQISGCIVTVPKSAFVGTSVIRVRRLASVMWSSGSRSTSNFDRTNLGCRHTLSFDFASTAMTHPRLKTWSGFWRSSHSVNPVRSPRLESTSLCNSSTSDFIAGNSKRWLGEVAFRPKTKMQAARRPLAFQSACDVQNGIN